MSIAQTIFTVAGSVAALVTALIAYGALGKARESAAPARDGIRDGQARSGHAARRRSTPPHRLSTPLARRRELLLVPELEVRAVDEEIGELIGSVITWSSSCKLPSRTPFFLRSPRTHQGTVTSVIPFGGFQARA